MTRKYLIICATSIVVCASTSSAQTRPDSSKRDTSVFRLREIVTMGTRPVTTSGGASALEVRPDSMNLPPAPAVDEVLRQLPFVQVRTNPRGEAYFSIRGSGFDAREVAVLIDGIPTTLNFDERSDLALLPAAGAQSLTLVRGLPSLLYGPNVLGGVVDMRLVRGAPFDTTPSARIGTGIDQTGAYVVSGAVANPSRIGSGNFVVRGGGAYHESTGFPLPHGVNEPAPFGDGDTRLNSYATSRDAFVATRYDADGGEWIALSSTGYSASRGTPAELQSTAPQLLRFPELRQSFTIASMGTGDSRSPFGGRGDLQASLGYNVARTKLDGFSTRAYTTIKNREDDTDHNLAARVVGSQSIGDRGDWQTAFTYADVKRHEILTPGATSEYRQRLWSGASELGWQIPATLVGLSALRATAGLAYDASDTPETGGKPQLAQLHSWGGRVGFTGVARENLLVNAGFNRRTRFPALREMYSGNLSMILPNPNLRPEILNAAEVGVTTELGRAQLQTVVFHNEIDDAIVRTTTAAKKVQRINRDHVNATGFEVLASAPIGRVTLAADMTAQNVTGKDSSVNQNFREEYQPKFAGGLRATTPLLLGTTLDAGARAVGTQYCVNPTATGYSRLGATMRTNAGISRDWHLRSGGWISTMQSSVGVDNIGNAAIYDQCGLPQPGRLLVVQLKLR